MITECTRMTTIMNNHATYGTCIVHLAWCALYSLCKQFNDTVVILSEDSQQSENRARFGEQNVSYGEMKVIIMIISTLKLI